ncbi:hypothetical protein METBIDRAFT_34173 [Metschnikowia bicuspidata var. bicuspidata NRRL YB-4993]|uniref:Ubiquitin-like protease family profile domain-containing protein n=1 Tax=Metschnikowia bicuspidata var. bicuspidata NRRL YB-4993 TaxID=869754 RepID=A0A1A0HKN0_9ASCO|nr:hypothetical protein METBIDRAFT_34173 [Metschnikowia bicuspidata var. bicuspidata NRRL YB-4993]OBA24363.1 hypothetical protein METBIDRAFT_34173 [Metschnikowia bicuspidata var. bicuspidata NRRL YB-4993]
MSLRKTYSSLRKLRFGGVMPQNRLGYPVHKIPIPTEHTVNQGKLFVVKPQNLKEKERKEDIKSCFFLATNIRESGLEDTPSLAMDVERADYNGTLLFLPDDGTLQVCVSSDEKLVFFKIGNALIDKMVLPENSLKAAYFADDYASAVFEFLKNFGYIYVSFVQTGRALYRFLRDRRGASVTKVSAQEMEEKHHHELRKYENFQRDPIAVVRPDDLSDEAENLLIDSAFVSDDILRNGLPSIPQTTRRKPLVRQTRSISKQADDANLITPLHIDSGVLTDRSTRSGEDETSIDGEPMQMIRETPALFDPPLYYSVDSEKKFVISYNDFKTLYNNDWINDTLIDFFIAYEMHRAVHELRLVQKNDIFAFNSFFFTKLLTNSNSLEVPPYYENIRRWLAKVDLMSYNSVIIPVNEHLHWFFIIIKNLPKLLEHAKTKQNHEIHAGDEKYQSTKTIVEIFVIDSLRQSHANLGPPLKDVIKQYCKEKHNVDISTDSIRFKNARVSKQRNFNDCGIHVIYNIRKWLGSPTTCELIWKTHGKPKSQIFKTSERDAMRRVCIDLLLDLHSKQPHSDLLRQNEKADDAQSDDEVELISCLSSYANNPEERMETEVSQSKDISGTSIGIPPESQKEATLSKKRLSDWSKEISESNDNLRPKIINGTSEEQNTEKEIHHKTLDPRVIDEASTMSSRSLENRYTSVEHPEIRRSLIGLSLNKNCVDFLNDIFKNNSQRYDEATRKRIYGLVEEYITLNSLEGVQIQKLEEKIKKALKKPPEPMDEPFVIEDLDESSSKTRPNFEDPDDSNSELNKSVGELSISGTRITDKRREDRIEEAKRRISSCSTNGSESSEIATSDLEIMDDDLELVSEVSLIFSSPQEKRERLTSKSPSSKKSRKNTGEASHSSHSRLEPEITQISEYQKPHTSPRSGSPKSSKAQWPRNQTSSSMAPKASKKTTLSDLSRRTRGSKEDRFSENTQSDDVVELTEIDEERHSPTRKPQEMLLKTTKRRRVEAVEKST